MSKDVTLTIDGISVTVPQGTSVVDAAKKVGIDIPIFCFHTKMEAVGMCRMCLVEIGRPARDRQTGEIQHNEDGSIKMLFGPKLETGCTVSAAQDMQVITTSEKVKDARRAQLEFLLTSHPLDCPICDKGGECPLQNLTMAHGPGTSRFYFEDKQKLAKNYPLGELIYLDQERCIQCARCIRFQREIVDDPVLEFYHRERRTEIITRTHPGFDSYYSGNTTDICPVGALTTKDFRLKARPWEMRPVASICNHCPVGCNIVFDTRRENASGGKIVVKRVMPRQNEQVNEIWICDKGRWVHHYAGSDERLTKPMVRKNGKLEEASWDEALDLAANKMKEVGGRLVTLVGGRLSNEDLFNLNQLTQKQRGKPILYSYMSGGDLVSQFGPTRGTNIGDMGKDDAILVIASDLREEAPIWWLRIKQAAERGAELIILNPRVTRLERWATHVIRYDYGQEVSAIDSLLPEKSKSNSQVIEEASQAFAQAKNALIFFGSEGIGLDTSNLLAQHCVDLLKASNHVGRPNNGLIGVWQNGNIQGAWDMGFRPQVDLVNLVKKAGVAYIVAADPAGDDPILSEAVDRADFVIVQELFLTETAKMADIVLPALPYIEREGSYTTGERRVQRFYPAAIPAPDVWPDYAVAAQIAERLELSLAYKSAPQVFLQIAEHVPGYAGLTYQKLSEVTEQWPIIGRKDLYYGGTSYDNHQGLGVHLDMLPPDTIKEYEGVEPAGSLAVPSGSLKLVPTTRLYDRSRLVLPSHLLEKRIAGPSIRLHPKLAETFGFSNGDTGELALEKDTYSVEIEIDPKMPGDVGLVPRSVGIPISQPVAAKIEKRTPKMQKNNEEGS